MAPGKRRLIRSATREHGTQPHVVVHDADERFGGHPSLPSLLAEGPPDVREGLEARLPALPLPRNFWRAADAARLTEELHEVLHAAGT